MDRLRAELDVIDRTPPGVSTVIGPGGHRISPVMTAEQGILYCDIDLSECVEPKQLHDLSGYYNRFDVFDLRVDRRRRPPVLLLDDHAMAAASER